MKEKINFSKIIGDDEYAHKDEDFRNVASKEREPRNVSDERCFGACEQEIDHVGVTAKGKLKDLFSELPKEDDQSLLEEIEKLLKK